MSDALTLPNIATLQHFPNRAVSTAVWCSLAPWLTAVCVSMKWNLDQSLGIQNMLRHKEIKDKCTTQKKKIQKYYLSISWLSYINTDKLNCSLKMSNCFLKQFCCCKNYVLICQKAGLSTSSHAVCCKLSIFWMAVILRQEWWKSNSFSFRHSTVV